MPDGTWIPVYTSLFRHPKLRDLAITLDLDTDQAAFWLIKLWLWAMEYASDGNLSRWTPAQVASGIGTDEAFGATLLAAMRQCGWLDTGDTLHDWQDYGGQLAHRKRAHAEASRNSRRNRNANAQQSRPSDDELYDQSRDDEPCEQQRDDDPPDPDSTVGDGGHRPKRDWRQQPETPAGKAIREKQEAARAAREAASARGEDPGPPPLPD